MSSSLPALGVLVLAFAGAAVLAWRRGAGPGALGGLAWLSGAVVAWPSVASLAHAILRGLSPVPLAAHDPLHVGVAAGAGALALASVLLPARVAVYAPLAAAAPLLLAPVAGLTGPMLALAAILLGALAPRAAVAALRGARPRLPAAVAAALLVLLVLPSALGGLLGFAWPQQHAARLEWRVDVDPTSDAPFVARVPFRVTDDAAAAKALAALREDVRLTTGTASLAWEGDVLVVRGNGGPVGLLARYDYVPTDATTPDRLASATRAPDADWGFEGDGAVVVWSFGNGCGEEEGGHLVLGDAPQPPTSPSPRGPPCIHGD